MKNLLKKLKNKKGFTLAELLIVVAIIAVLVAISIPIFTAQLEKAREATDAANLRAAYGGVFRFVDNYHGCTSILISLLVVSAFTVHPLVDASTLMPPIVLTSPVE